MSSASEKKSKRTKLAIHLRHTCKIPESIRRSAHNLVYEKNLDEHVTPSAVPDDVIRPQSDKYWAPNPQTGVFGPASEHTGSERGFHSTSPGSADVGGDSVLEQKAFFRPLEDLDKPHHP